MATMATGTRHECPKCHHRSLELAQDQFSSFYACRWATCDFYSEKDPWENPTRTASELEQVAIYLDRCRFIHIRSRDFLLQLIAYSQDKTAIARIRHELRGTVSRQGKGFRWTISGRAALAALRRVLPYLEIRRPEAEVAIQIAEATEPDHKAQLARKLARLKGRRNA